MRVVSKSLFFAAFAMLAPAVAQAGLVVDQNYDPSFNAEDGFASSPTRACTHCHDHEVSDSRFPGGPGSWRRCFG